ncbi:MAG: hypothetical protein ABR968_06540 [Bacteroidales bacterium]|jgi:hypothetical protein
MKTINQLRKRQTKCTRYLLCCAIVLSATISNLFAQNVLVTDDSNYVAKTSAMLDIKSSNKGLLIPRVNLTATTSALPITSPDSSLIVYNKATAGNVTPGYYFWDGGKWVRIANGQGGLNVVTKTASATLLPTETMVLASNNITLTLPAITSTDDGLAISVKNNGTYTDLITVVPNGAATVDGVSNSTLTRWKGRTYVAVGGNWIVQDKETRSDNLYDISATGSWTTIAEMIAFLNLHMTSPTVVRLGGGTYSIAATQTINLSYPVTFEGLSDGETTIAAAVGVYGSPLFICQTESYFKMLTFITFVGTAGNDGLVFPNSGTYHEIKECTFYGLNRGIVSTSNHSNIIVFATAFVSCAGAGIEIAEGLASGGNISVNQCYFSRCNRGVNLLSGVSQSISLFDNTFGNTTAGTDIAILYTPATLTSFKNIYIASNSWNNQGTYISGFDFTRPDGRDASALIEGNVGVGNSSPMCKVNVVNNVLTTTTTNANTYYKAAWTNTSSIPCKFTVANNKITYQSTNKRNAFVIITGDIAVNSAIPVLTICIVKNGVTATPYGETNIKISAANQPFQFATVIELDNIGPTDYFEVYIESDHAGNIITFEDVQWYTECK